MVLINRNGDDGIFEYRKNVIGSCNPDTFYIKSYGNILLSYIYLTPSDYFTTNEGYYYLDAELKIDITGIDLNTFIKLFSMFYFEIDSGNMSLPTNNFFSIPNGVGLRKIYNFPNFYLGSNKASYYTYFKFKLTAR